MNSFRMLLTQLATEEGRQALADLRRGLEREALRVTSTGELAQNAHPKSLGSALTHSRITTDYSESLLELITPVSNTVEQLLEGLTQTHAFTAQNIGKQLLWPLSMPCDVTEPSHIAVAQYGSSNIGKMKTVYRHGLTHRYGALMQIISGVHYNFSVSPKLWQILYQQSDKSLSLSSFISEGYLGLIRNYRKMVWLIVYLFGASPALYRSFLQNGQPKFAFQDLNSDSLYLPYATSLRMSDLGYTSSEQAQLNINYNSLEQYVTGLKKGIHQPSIEFAKIGVKVAGQYRQLNDNILQIENEFYSPIRPKRVTLVGEKPSDALVRAGVEYIEVRALDVNPFSPLGVDASQLHWLDLFLLYCLLSPADKLSDQDERDISDNFNKVVLEGRRPDLQLSRNGSLLSLTDWANEIFTGMGEIAELLTSPESTDYRQALNYWQQAVVDPTKTLSARVLELLANSNGNWGLELAKEYADYFKQYPISDEINADFVAESKSSLTRQVELEQADKQDFDSFLHDYFHQ